MTLPRGPLQTPPEVATTPTPGKGLPAPLAPKQYTTSNVTPDRTFDADSTSTAELADVLGTLISDLREAGLIR